MGQLLLVRHGQASFGADDYDVLSPVGEEQARTLGATLTGLDPALLVHGSLKRQRRTAEIMAGAAGWTLPATVDERWNELDHLSQFASVTPGELPAEGDPDAFQRWYERAMHRWTTGGHDADYTESYDGFCDRAVAALTELAGRTDGADAVVATSGGPLAAIVTRLLDAGPETYLRLLPVVVNSSVTRVVSGRRGLSLVSFNEHTHLSEEQLTYR
jgi:broad specificity phosphatase PhoE